MAASEETIPRTDQGIGSKLTGGRLSTAGLAVIIGLSLVIRLGTLQDGVFEYMGAVFGQTVVFVLLVVLMKRGISYLRE